MKKKSVFLFGAGAVLDWGGPRTLCNRESYEIIPEHGTDQIKNRSCCLTHRVITTGFVDKNGERISNKIYKVLKTKKPNANVNFETIINIVEDLYAYWSVRKSKESNNIYSIVDIDDDLKDFHCFEVSQAKGSPFYSIIIPGVDPSFSDTNLIPDEIDPHEKYYELLLNELLSGIIGQISKYSYASSEHNVFDKPFNDALNANFGAWMKSFLNKKSSIRFYTINYDDVFKVLLEKHKVSVFDGFFENSNDVYNAENDLAGVVLDKHEHIHYNLHGFAFWKVEDLNRNELQGYRYFKFIPGIINDSVASIQIEKGRKILLSNIISGFQKVQKTAISPFRQFFSALDKDCFEAEELFIIGYSFGDEHINDIIRNARRYNHKMQITLINPTFDELRFILDFVSHWGTLQGGIFPKQDENIFYSNDFKVKVIQKPFGEFLKDFKNY
jgi:hypothetical protein